MSNEIMVTDRMSRDIIQFQESAVVAQAICKGLGEDNHYKVMMRIQLGKELGAGLMEAVTGIKVIPGSGNRSPTVVVEGVLMRSLIRKSNKYDYQIIEATDKICTMAITKSGKEIGRSSYTIEEAQAAGLMGKDNWKRHPGDMLVARCSSRVTRRHCPDILSGAYCEDEGEEIAASCVTGIEEIPMVQSTPPAPVEPTEEPEVVVEPPPEKEESKPRKFRTTLTQATEIVGYIHAKWPMENKDETNWSAFNSWLTDNNMGVEPLITHREHIQKRIERTDAKIIMAALKPSRESQ